MHESLHSDIKMYIDKFCIENVKICIEGWVASSKHAIVSVSLQVEGVSIGHASYGKPRPDVFQHYGSTSMGFLNSGFTFEHSFVAPSAVPSSLSLVATLSSGEKILVHTLEIKRMGETTNCNFALRPSITPEFLVVDNFYDDPDQVRNFALNVKYKLSPMVHKGERSDLSYCPEHIKISFERLLGKRITNWNNLENGKFQFCTAEDAIVYHCDLQSYAAVVFLTPDAPPESGTSFYRSRKLKLRKEPTAADIRRLGFSSLEETLLALFSQGHYDRTQFELVDVVGNVYNRMIMWDAKLLHAASQYFGTNKENGRLFHMFFFDAKDEHL